MQAACWLLLIVAAILLAVPALGEETEPLALGTRREIFVDRYLIAALSGVQMVPHEPRDEGRVFAFDQPWEGPFCGYATLLYDGSRYRLYYRGLPQPKHDTGLESLCYAESADGLHWDRPELGLVAFNGSRRNNILIGGSQPGTHSFAPFLDTRPGVPASERFKALGLERLASKQDWALAGFVSEDGIHWRRLRPEPIIFNDTPTFAFDSQNVAFWSESEGKYVAYGRTWKDGVRRISRFESPDFLHWSGSHLMEYRHDGRPAPVEEMYTNQTHPYFRAPHIYLATAARFFPGRQALTEEEARAIQVDPGYFKDTSDSVLMSTRGGYVYDRTFLTAFIKPGLGPQNWVSRSNYPALNIVPTGPNEMSVYVCQNYGQPSAHLRRYSLRLDGLASLRADYEPGEIRTKRFTFTGDRLTLNFATSAAGGIRVELQDEHGKPIPGYALEDCREIIGNEIARDVSWKRGPEVSALAGRVVRLRIVMRDADLYALQFHRK
jgi:hypothetical protein